MSLRVKPHLPKHRGDAGARAFGFLSLSAEPLCAPDFTTSPSLCSLCSSGADRPPGEATCGRHRCGDGARCGHRRFARAGCGARLCAPIASLHQQHRAPPSARCVHGSARGCDHGRAHGCVYGGDRGCAVRATPRLRPRRRPAQAFEPNGAACRCAPRRRRRRRRGCARGVSGALPCSPPPPREAPPTPRLATPATTARHPTPRRGAKTATLSPRPPPSLPRPAALSRQPAAARQCLGPPVAWMARMPVLPVLHCGPPPPEASPTWVQAPPPPARPRPKLA